MQLILATRNAHKTREIRRILGSAFEVNDLSKYSGIPEINETGESFEENAKLKAAVVSRHLQGLIVADDSGLEVDAMGGAPGIHSARYAGPEANDAKNIEKLLCELSRVKAAGDQRSARFRCVLALAQRGRILGTFSGMVEGRIADQPRTPSGSAPRGSGGFGYDPVFLPEGSDQTFAELSAEGKDRVSHRARALEKLRAFLLSGEMRKL